MSDILIAGVGGQGTVLAAKLLAKAALLEGHMVRTAETIGMAQRGGTVLGHVRIFQTSTYGGARSGSFSNEPMSPLIPPGTADLLIGFEPGETVRALPFLKHGGTVVTARQVLIPASFAAAIASKATENTVTRQAYDGAAELEYLRSCCKVGRLESLVVVDGNAVCSALGSYKVLNVLLLGAALSAECLSIAGHSLIAALEALTKPEFLELNKRALAIGMGSEDLYG